MPYEFPNATYPPGYPVHFQRRIILSDGRAIRIRPALQSDTDMLLEVLASAPASEVHRRFPDQPSESLPRLIEQTVANVNHVTTFFLLAWDEHDTLVGSGSYRRLAGSVSPVAVIGAYINPGWRKVGLSTELFSMLAARAHEVGIERLTSVFLAEDVAARHIAEREGTYVIDQTEELAVSYSLADDILNLVE
jgi:RimJ/RimL family protein N-acetyltransferase